MSFEYGIVYVMQFIAVIHKARPDLESKLPSMRILDDNPQRPVVHMTNLCVVSSHTVRVPFFGNLQREHLISLLGTVF